MSWVEMHDPTAEEVRAVAGEFGVPVPVAESLGVSHHRPRIERIDGLLSVVLRTARYADESETVEFGEIQVLVGQSFVVTIGRGEYRALGTARRRVEGDPDRLGSEAVLYAIVDEVVGGYEPVVEGLETDTDEVETQVFEGHPGVSRRVYELYREAVQFHRATNPLSEVIERLAEGEEGESRSRLRGARDRVLRVTERVEDIRELLTSILSVNLTLIGINQNDQTKRISAWAAILLAPTLVTGLYGMNFRHMPELGWALGYPFSLALMLVISLLLYRAFKRAGWL
ncbi:magnesium and cobalt transport protein CorA [Rubrobacter marinus]|nr:magnesium and cobalt transport protein CorA [Rubrobacter marinus]